MAATRTILLVSAGVLALGTGACSPSPEPETPLLVIAGPDDFLSFEMRDSGGEAIWRLEAASPSPITALVYAQVPAGFRQTLPENSAPRPLEIGEDLIMESRTPDRAFLHRSFAKTRETVTILATEMRRIPVGQLQEPSEDPPQPRDVTNETDGAGGESS